MRALFQDFLPNRAIFFDKFDEAAKNAADMASLLASIVATEDAEKRGNLYKQVDRLEHTGDDITHKIYLCLDRIIFTPLNRNDIHTLAAAIDDVADMVQEASGRLNLYNIVNFIPPIKELCALTEQASRQLQSAVNLLRANHTYEAIINTCRRVKELERQADNVYYNALAELFLNDKDAINLIKYREILHSLENAMNKCKTAADALEVIMINK